MAARSDCCAVDFPCKHSDSPGEDVWWCSGGTIAQEQIQEHGEEERVLGEEIRVNPTSQLNGWHGCIAILCTVSLRQYHAYAEGVALGH